MEDEKQSGLSKAASTSGIVQGAIKTGKAIADVAKGASAAGPYGAVAGALWANRKTVTKILIAVGFIFSAICTFCPYVTKSYFWWSDRWIFTR